MKIRDLIRKLEDNNVHPNYEKIRQRYKAVFKEETWMNFDVTFYILLIDEPLWKFIELHDKWYEAKTKYNATFLSGKPTDKQIEDYINGKEITFE